MRIQRQKGQKGSTGREGWKDMTGRTRRTRSTWQKLQIVRTGEVREDSAKLRRAGGQGR
jgi:hypothetical protein